MSRYALPPPHEADDVRGTKRTIAGWTAPARETTLSTMPSVLAAVPPRADPHVPYPTISEPNAKSEPREEAPNPNANPNAIPIPIPTIKHEPTDTKHSPSPAPQTVPTPARMGTRVPGSGDLANTGARTVVWPAFPGVSVGERNAHAQEVITEEECYTWTDLPMNKQGFRYIPCGASPVASPSVAHPFYRRVPALHAAFGAVDPPTTDDAASSTSTSSLASLGLAPVHLDPLDRSPYLKLSPSFHTCTAEKGFRSVRGNVPVRSGTWYYEALIVRGGGDSGSDSAPAPPPPSSSRAGRRFGRQAGDMGGAGAHVRIGFARREAPLNGPAGLDGYSYAIRDATGQAVHLSRPRAYSSLGGFGTGDVIGCLIDLPPRARPAPPIKRKRIPIRYKGQLYFESMEYTVPKEMDALVARDGRPVPEPEPEPVPGPEEDVKPKPPVPSPMKKKGKAAGATAAAAAKGRKKPGKRDPDSEEAEKQPRARPLPRLTGSSIRFFLNGQPMAASPAFEDLFDFTPLPPTEAERASKAALVKKLGALEASLRDRENECDDGTLGYYPFISCFGGGKVQFNPGPTWMAPVAPDAWGLGAAEDGHPRVPRAFSERWNEFTAEETTYDRADEDELTALLCAEHAAETASARKRARPSKGKSSVSKRASIAAAMQASSIPNSRASSEATGAGAVEKNEAYLATVVQERGTPGGTPVPGTPVRDGSAPAEPPQIDASQTVPPHTPVFATPAPPLHATAPPSHLPPTETASPQIMQSDTPVQPTSPTQIPSTVRQASSSATSEDAIGEDDWSPAVTERMAAEDDEAPELPYGMEVVESLDGGAGQIQQ